MMERKAENEKVVERKAERKEEKEKEKVRKEKGKEKAEKAKERSTELMIPMVGATMKKIIIRNGMEKIGTMTSRRLSSPTCSRKNLHRLVASSGRPPESDGARRRERELLLTRVCRTSVACLGSTSLGSQSVQALSGSR